MVKKIFFFIFAVLTVAGIVMTVVCWVAAKAEYEHVYEKSGGGASGVNYLAAYMTQGEAYFFAAVSVINGFVAFILGITADWKKKSAH